MIVSFRLGCGETFAIACVGLPSCVVVDTGQSWSVEAKVPLVIDPMVFEVDGKIFIDRVPVNRCLAVACVVALLVELETEWSFNN